MKTALSSFKLQIRFQCGAEIHHFTIVYRSNVNLDLSRYLSQTPDAHAYIATLS